MNTHQLRALCFDLFAKEELSFDSAFQRIRRDHTETFNAHSRNELEQYLKVAEAEAKAIKDTPLAEAFLFLVYAEVSLRGDMAEALNAIEPADPAETRELVQLVAHLGARDTGEGFHAASELRDAVSVFEERDPLNAINFQARLDYLYPTKESDSE